MAGHDLRGLAGELRASLHSVIEDEAERAALESELDDALSRPDPESERRLVEVLRARPETRAWMRERDPALEDSERLTGLAGDPTALLGTYFVCPQSDFDYVREGLDEQVPLCP